MHGVSRLERPGPGINITFASVHHDMAATAALVSTTRLIQEVFFLIIRFERAVHTEKGEVKQPNLGVVLTEH